uniref:Lipocalin n=1 Tax=Rhipicephalus appendiculatus TaxID=34631 RepID=A0A131YTS2_RHIAP
MCKRFTLRSSILAALCYTITIGSTFSETLLDNGENPNIIKVLNTSEKLWVVWQSENNTIELDVTYEGNTNEFYEEETCIYIQKKEISDTNYNFTARERILQKWDETACYGKFEPNENKPPKSMTVECDIDQPQQLLTLGFSDEDPYKCYVFFVNSLDPTRPPNELQNCEMYIPNSHVATDPPPSCKTFYEEKCPKQIYKPYKPQCKTLRK